MAVRKLIGDSKSVLVVGGGVVGVQVAGELTMAFGDSSDKHVEMCVRGSRLLKSLPEKAARLADKYLSSHGVKIMYNTFYESIKETKSYDLVVMATGYKFMTEFMKKDFPQCLHKNGQIYVNEYMQITD
jgi:apoptosis-inducing factor 2